MRRPQGVITHPPLLPLHDIAGKEELKVLLGEERLAGASLLIFANKQDL